MKRYILSLLSLVVLAACSSYDESFEKPIDEPTDNDNNIAEKVIVSAYINGSDDTRVAMTPGTDAEEHPIIKVNWKDSGEKFLVYSEQFWQDGNFSEINNPNEFNQVSGNEFQGNSLYGVYHSAFYNCSLKGEWRSALRLSYDISKQDGTLNEKNVLMKSRSTTNTPKFNFSHMGFILKPTFKFREAGEATPRDMDALITKIEMENVQYVKTDTYVVDRATSSVEIGVESIYTIGDTVTITLTPVNGTATVKINNKDYVVTNDEVTFTANVTGE